MPYADLEVRKEYHRNYMRRYRTNMGCSRRPSDKVTRRNGDKELRLKLLDYYSKGTMLCTHCGFSDVRALTLDHLNNNGREENKRLGIKTSAVLYRRLRKQDYPDGYMTLCMNCQFIKRYQHYQETRICVL